MKNYILLIVACFAYSYVNAQTITTVAGGNGQGFGANQFHYPTSIIVDANGNMYVCDALNHRIQKFPSGSNSSTNGETVASFGLSAPEQICLDQNGYLYVADPNNNRVQRFSPGSDSMTHGVTVAANHLGAPTGVCLDRNGNLYVAEYDSNRITKFPANSDSTTIGVIVAGGNGQGNAPNQLYRPYILAMDDSDNLYISDQFNVRVQKFQAGSTSATNGITVAGGNGYGSALNQMLRLDGIFVDSHGFVYACDYDNYRVLKFPPGGTSANNAEIVAGGNGRGSNASQLDGPGDLFVDENDNVYVSDFSNNRIQKWTRNPNSIFFITDLSLNVIYPNPNSGSFMLESVNSIGREFSIYDLIGKEAMHQTIASDKQMVELKGLSTGVYTLDIKGSSNRIIRFTVNP